MARVQFQVEFMFKASPSIIYLFVTQATAIVRWFCDKVDNIGDTYTFSWKGSDESADLVAQTYRHCSCEPEQYRCHLAHRWQIQTECQTRVLLRSQETKT